MRFKWFCSADIGSGRSAHLHVEIGVVQMWVV